MLYCFECEKIGNLFINEVNYTFANGLKPHEKAYSPRTRLNLYLFIYLFDHQRKNTDTDNKYNNGNIKRQKVRFEFHFTLYNNRLRFNHMIMMVAKLVACTGQNSFHCCCLRFFDYTPVKKCICICIYTKPEFIDRIHFIQSNTALQSYKHHPHTDTRTTCVCTILSKADFCLFHCCFCCCRRWLVSLSLPQ